MKKNLLIFLKGILMGICDLIPGISGGTVAFITGIYSRLINAVKGFSLKLIFNLFRSIGSKKYRQDLREDIKKLDLGFLFVLILGILTAILIGSRIINVLLENYFSYTLSFFIGLILASSVVIYKDIENHNKLNISFGFLGFVFGLLISLAIPITTSPTYFYVFLGGFFSISAMFLPGISGAFILLIMGLYSFMIDILHDILSKLSYFLVFVLGALLGAFCISRIVSFLFRKDKCKTLYFLLGLVIGALSIPLKVIYVGGDFHILKIIGMLILFVLGFIIVRWISSYKEYRKEIFY